MEQLADAILDLRINKCQECGRDSTVGMFDEVGFRCMFCLPDKIGLSWIQDFQAENKPSKY